MPDNLKVLIVDDDALHTEMVMDYLRLSGKFNLTWADSLESLWAKLVDQSYDLILMDFRLPDGTGINAIEELRRRNLDIPVVMLTGQGDERIAVKAIQSGASDYLLKHSDYLRVLPTVIQKTVRNHQIEVEHQKSLALSRYQALLLNNVRDAIIVWNIHGEITYWNLVADQFFGQSKAIEKNKPIEKCYLELFQEPIELPSSDDPTRVTDRWYQYWDDGKSEMWVSSRITALYDYETDGQLMGYMAVLQDITPRAKAEEALRQRLKGENLVAKISTDFINLPSEAFQNGIQNALEAVCQFNGAECGYIVADVGDNINTDETFQWCNEDHEKAIATNPTAEDLPLGLSLLEKDLPWIAEQLDHFKDVTISDVSQLPNEARVDQQYFKRRGVQSVVLVPLVFNGVRVGFLGCESMRGKKAWAQEDTVLLQTVGGIITIALKRRQMEEQVQRSQKYLLQTARLSSIGELASGVAHLINNPLTTIIADSQLLLHELPADHPSRESADAIEKAGWQAQKVVQRLVDFSRPPTDEISLVDVNQTIERSLELIGSNIQSTGVMLEFQPDDSLPMIMGSDRKLEDLWVNLLLLAQDATADGSNHSIQIRSYADVAKGVWIEVKDDGRPIPPECLPTIFEPEYYGPTSGRGSGIELSVCNEIVRHHRGKITVLSDHEHGTIFSIYLPGG